MSSMERFPGEEYKAALNAHIYAYLIEEQCIEAATTFKASSVPFNDELVARINHKRLIDEAPDEDSKRDANNLFNMHGNKAGGIALLDWWSLFWDMHTSSQRRAVSGPTAQYLASQTQQNNIRMQQQLNPNPQMFQTLNNYGRMVPGPLNPGLVKTAMVNNTRMNGYPPQLPNMRGQQMNNMQRDGNEVDMTGQQREISPSADASGPSPKRQRLDGPGFNGQMNAPGGGPMVNGQPNGGAPNAAMLTSGFDPNSMSPASFKPGNQVRQYSQNLAQNLVVQSRANLERLQQGNNNGSPMVAGQNGQFGQEEMYQGAQQGQMRQMPMPGGSGGMPAGAPGTQGGALADYQMQLMLLEQQNKRRLLMARQESESVTGTQTMNPGLAPGMSPRQGSRTGNSPPGSDPARRGTPKLGQDGLPESNGNRASPIPVGVGMEHNFRSSGMTPQLFAQMHQAQTGQMQNGNGMSYSPGMPNGMGAEAINIMRQRGPMNANMVGQWAQGVGGPGPMMQNPMMQQMDQRQSMPPPQAPVNGAANRNQPGSPAQAPAPPTPSQANKPKPGKKETKEKQKKGPKKNTNNNTIAATPTADGEPSDDVPPPTPSTPKNADSDRIKGPAPQNQLQNVQPLQQQQQPMQQPQQPQQMLPQQQPNMANMSNAQNNNAFQPPPFGGIMGDNVGDMSGMFEDGGLDAFTNFGDGPDVLGAFDFDSFLHTDPGMEFDPTQFTLGAEGLESAGDV